MLKLWTHGSLEFNTDIFRVRPVSMWLLHSLEKVHYYFEKQHGTAQKIKDRTCSAFSNSNQWSTKYQRTLFIMFKNALQQQKKK